ncbi:MAG: substrate-binding domain-containing protein [Eubacteriales bacterium]|nr:substrate-binding domain-containing protein [Eubacteriales bacterium]
MKKAAVAAAGIFAAITLLAGCRKEDVEKVIEPLVAEVKEEEEAETMEEIEDDSEAESVEEDEEKETRSEIDTSIPIQAGARVAVVSKNTKGEFWELVNQGMEEAVDAVNEAYGYEKDDKITLTFEGPDDEQKVDDQINILDAVIAENPDVLCLAAGDMDSCQAQIESARENGIPVVVFDSNVSERKLIRAFRGTDNTLVGEMAAYRLGRAIGKMGKVAVFSAQEKTESAKNRTEGFLANIANYTDIEVVEVVYQDQVEDMEAAMQEVLAKYPTLDGVFCTNADVAEMYLDMEKEEREQKIAMVGVDATSRQLEAIEAGEEIGVVSQNPKMIGYETVWAALQATAPKKAKVQIEKAVYFDPVWIDRDNMDDPEYSDYIYAE